MQHVAYALQFENNLVDFLRRSAGNAPGQLILFFGGWVISRVSLAPLLVVAPDELTDLTLDRADIYWIMPASFTSRLAVARKLGFA